MAISRFRCEPVDGPLNLGQREGPAVFQQGSAGVATEEVEARPQGPTEFWEALSTHPGPSRAGVRGERRPRGGLV